MEEGTFKFRTQEARPSKILPVSVMSGWMGRPLMGPAMALPASRKFVHANESPRAAKPLQSPPAPLESRGWRKRWVDTFVGYLR
jgi:hypothetical protein